jgi:H+/Cl- antiporter ClcA
MRLSAAEAALLLSVLGVACGLLTGLVTLAFRAAIELGQQLLLPAGPESYEALAPLLRLLVPAAGGLLIGLYLWRVAAPAGREMGVIHVVGRWHTTRATCRSAMQFISSLPARFPSSAATPSAARGLRCI